MKEGRFLAESPFMAPFASERRAFVLPFTLLLATTLLVLALLALEQSRQRLRENGADQLRFQTETLITRSVPSLAGRLNRILRDGHAASALLDTAWGEAGLRSVAVAAGAEQPVPLYSVSHDSERGEVQFRSPVKDLFLQAGLTAFSPPGSQPSVSFAWAAEDIALHSPLGRPFPAWPASQWAGSPQRAWPDAQSLGDAGPTGSWPEGPWITEESLPFTPAASPALVPVLSWLGLRFGIFASGKSGSREKTVRIRYYVEGGIWNPYNRPMRFHEGSARRPVFRAGFMNLPAVRLRNLTKGVTTGWIQMDEALNGQTGEAGLEAWIRLPGMIGAGAGLPFLEPDGKDQPEGLARTLHPAFPVDPADRVIIDFRPSPGGLHAVCLPMGDVPLREAWSSGTAWYAILGFPAEFESLAFDRADAVPAPFYLEGGSLAFRQANAHFQVLFSLKGDVMAGRIDPRRRTVAPQVAFLDAEGRQVSGGDLLLVEVVPLRDAPPRESALFPAGPLFSWPRRMPQTVLEATDLPAWSEGFRLGSPKATAINGLLDREGPILNREAPERVTCLPVNLIDARAWETVFRASSLFTAGGHGMAFAAFPEVSENRQGDFFHAHPVALEWAAESLVREIGKRPSASVSDFFNRGLLGEVLPEDGLAAPLQALLPLRGWLRKAPPLRRHGSAWVLHLFAQGFDGEQTFRRSARAWLLETPQPDGPSRFALIRFEWTDPDQHCRFPPD